MSSIDTELTELDRSIEQILSKLVGPFSLTYLAGGKPHTIGKLPRILIPRSDITTLCRSHDCVRPDSDESSGEIFRQKGLDAPNLSPRTVATLTLNPAPIYPLGIQTTATGPEAVTPSAAHTPSKVSDDPLPIRPVLFGSSIDRQSMGGRADIDSRVGSLCATSRDQESFVDDRDFSDMDFDDDDQAFIEANYATDQSISRGSDSSLSVLGSDQSLAISQVAPVLNEEVNSEGRCSTSDVWKEIWASWGVPASSSDSQFISAKFQELACAIYHADSKRLASELLSGLYPNRRKSYSFRKGVLLPNWPRGVRYVDPYHLLSKERTDLLIWLMLSPYNDVEAIELHCQTIGRKMKRPVNLEVLLIAFRTFRKRLASLVKKTPS